jgi:LmbE family N-acetylglucosaminyl deacetylase
MKTQEKKKSIVYICAHPDDILSVAGTLCLLKKQGYKIYDFCMTRGEKLNDTPKIGEIRSTEEEKACRIIGAELKFFEQPDSAIYADKAICEKIAEELKRIKPEAVFTLWALEKPDHAAAYMIAAKALNLAGLEWDTEFYMSKVDIQNHCFRPDMYVNVSSVMDTVETIANCYESHFDTEFLEYTLQGKRLTGKAMFVDAAESFMYCLDPINNRFNCEDSVGKLLRSIN